jgi:hypothetical protein
MELKAISLWQPWATAIALGKKQYETRSWGTTYRGRLLICSAKKELDESASYARSLVTKGAFNPKDFPLGVAICVCDLVDCLKMDSYLIDRKVTRYERQLGDWSIGRYAWKLDRVIPVEPIPIKGQQGLFTVDWQEF